MDSKIKTLIEKLSLSKECIDYLEGAKLNRIVANKEKTNYCFYIDINNTSYNNLSVFSLLLKTSLLFL